MSEDENYLSPYSSPSESENYYNDGFVDYEYENNDLLYDSNYSHSAESDYEIIIDRSLVKSLPYLKNIALEMEKLLITHVQVEICRKNLYDECYFDTVMCYISTQYTYRRAYLDIYKDIIEYSLFDSQQNREIFHCGLRILFLRQFYLRFLEKEKIDCLVSKLILLATSDADPENIYSIKLLQVIIYNFKLHNLNLDCIKDFYKILIENSIALVETFNYNIGVNHSSNPEHENNCSDFFSVNNEFLKSLADNTTEEINLYKNDYTLYINECSNINLVYKQFHHLGLLKCLIPLFQVSELSIQHSFVHLFYKCIDRTIFRSKEILCLALSIISNCICDQNFWTIFFETGGITRLRCISHSTTSSILLLRTFRKISETLPAIKHLIKNDADSIILIIRYCVNIGSVYEEAEALSDIHFNLLQYPESIEIYAKTGLAINLLKQIKTESLSFVSEHNELMFYITNNIYKSSKNIVNHVIKIFLFQIFLETFSQLPNKIKNSLPSFDIHLLNQDILNRILNYLEKNGRIKNNLKIFEDLLDIEAFEVIFFILKMTVEGEVNESIMDGYKSIMLLLRFISLNDRGKELFLHPFGPFVQNREKANHLIHFFISTTEKFSRISHDEILEYMHLPFDVYHNILMKCFPEIELYKKIIKFELHEKETLYELLDAIADEIANNFIDTLLQHSIIHHILIFILNPKSKLTYKTYAIKCLLILLARKNVTQVFSVLYKSFIQKFSDSLVIVIHSEQLTRELNRYLKYSIILIFKIMKCYFPHFILEGLKTEKNTDAIIFFEKGKNIAEILKLAIINLKKMNFSKRRTLKDLVIIMDMFNSTILPPNRKSPKKLQLTLYERHKTDNKLEYNCCKNQCAFIKKLNIYTPRCKGFLKRTKYIHVYSRPDTRSAKLLIDDNIVLTDKNQGVINLGKNKPNYMHSTPLIYYIEDSFNGEYIIGNGISENYDSQFTNIWKYDPLNLSVSIQPKIYIPNINSSKMTHDHKSLFGVSKNLVSHTYDIESCRLIKSFSNPSTSSLPRINSAHTDSSDNMMLFNGDLYCMRSQKLIHSFLKFGPPISGNFIHFDSKVLINSELWDLRKFALFDRIEQFENLIIKRTHIHDILFGIELNYKMNVLNFNECNCNLDDFSSTYGKFLAIYDSKNYTQLVKLNYDYNLLFANISRNCTKIITGICEGNFTGRINSLNLIEIGCESNVYKFV